MREGRPPPGLDKYSILSWVTLTRVLIILVCGLRVAPVSARAPQALITADNSLHIQ